MKKNPINYNHLYYFWVVARLGSVTRACEELRLAQSTISSQIHLFEESLGEQLFQKRGRNLTLTEPGQIALRYCNQIFGLGAEMFELIEGNTSIRPELIRIGVADTVPKILVHHMLKPLMEQNSKMKLVISESSADRMLGDLAIHLVDAIILDCPMPPSVHVRAYNHLMAESGVSFVCQRSLAKKLPKKFPTCLSAAPMLLPTHAASVRVDLDRWFERHEITPQIAAEFQDSALMKIFGRDGAGVFPIPTIVEKDICREMDCLVLGRISDPIERYYLVTTEKRVRNPFLRLIGYRGNAADRQYLRTQ